MKLGAELRRPIVVTDFVLLELANAYAATESRGRLAELWRHLRNDPAASIVLASAELIERGLALYSQRPDKEWSLTDCTSFVVMQERGLTEALTSDRHFVQAGFIALLT